MPAVEIYTDEDDAQPLMVAEFDFLPRMGEYLALDVDDELIQFDVAEVWHRQDDDGRFSACVRVETSDT
ncbi:hypothetical protein HT136_08725 [Novosphingobium profundi]|uniref:hypothetical protein n=1 Tax=Novosphingobium profundi TaxID=1774954 RepID=UPI001BDAA60A|nr:hypothetical protein [Novosphingobium profundi]MBT0668453.1 hypothetical protein [Novosphingobium profundi]